MYTFLAFVDNAGQIKVSQYNDVTKNSLLELLTTENRPIIFNEVDYLKAEESAKIKLTNATNVSQSV